MNKILITGAAGNLGMAVVKSLKNVPPTLQIIAGIRDFNSDKQKLSSCWIDFVKFGFLDATTYKLAL
jgi:nucleoside-diphosphate-sugar epimerase